MAIHNFELQWEYSTGISLEKVSNGIALSREEHKGAAIFYINFMRYLENNHFQYQQGVLDEETWAANVEGMRLTCSNPLWRLVLGYPDWTNENTYRKSFADFIRSLCG